MADKLMIISNDDAQNYLYCIGITIEQNDQNSIEVPKVVRPANKKTLFGDWSNKQPNVPFLSERIATNIPEI